VTDQTTVWRGIQERHFDQMVNDLKPGDIFEYKGFMSATPDKKLARTFSEWKDDKDLYVNVTIKPGSKALEIPDTVKYMDKREAGKETLIGRAQQFRYNGVTTTDDAMIINIESM